MRMKSSILCIFVLTLFLQSAAATESGGKSGGADKSGTPTVQGKEKQEVKTPQKQSTVSNDVSEKTGKKKNGTEARTDPAVLSTGEAPDQNNLEETEGKDGDEDGTDFPSMQASEHPRSEQPPVPPSPRQQVLQEREPSSSSAFPELSFIIAAAALLLLLIILIAAMAAGNYTTAKVLKQIKQLDKRLLALENDVKALKQPRSGKQERDFAGAIDGTASFPDSGISISGRTRQESVQKPAAPAEPPDTISPLYSAPAERAKRRDEAPGDIFLDISQSIFTRVQRRERISFSSVLLEEEGTWRNSQFVLIGQQLYFNFYFYNETKELSADSPQMERVLAEMYTIQGTLPGSIQRCVPAKVIRNKTGYTVAGKGLVVIG